MLIPFLGHVQRGLDSRTLDWVQRCTDGIDPWNYICAIDDLMQRGRERGWIDEFGELLILGSMTPRGSLEGFKDFIHYDDVTIVGDIIFTPLFGIERADLSQNSYIDLNKEPDEFPGVILNSHSIGVYVTTNLIGPYNIAGATGTAGSKSFNVIEGGGFRSGVRLGSDQIIFGDSSSWGWIAGSRTGASAASTWRQQAIGQSSVPVGSLPSANFTLLSSEPGGANSPNRLLIVWVGAGLTDELGAAMAEDIIRFVRLVGIYGDIEVAPIVFGPNCFGPTALDDITPVDLRVYRQLSFPPSNGMPAASYGGYPITDSIVRSVQEQTVTELLINNPLETFSGTGTVRITMEGHASAVGDVIRLSGCEAVNGIAAGQLNKRHQITGVSDASPDDGWVEIVTEGTASSSASGGGASVTAQLTRFVAPTSEFIPPRNGRFWTLVWSCRGERDEAGGPITSPTQKGNDSYGPITRLTDTGGDGPLAGTQCRPVYTTKRLAAGATLVHAAHVCGYLDRDDPDDPEGQGYLDIAEEWGLDPDQVKSKAYFLANADVVFTTALAGYAVVYDWVILAARTLVDAMPHLSAAQKGICLDCEHGDQRSAELQEEYMTRLASIVHAKGMKMTELAHYKNGTQFSNNGWTQASHARVAALDGVETLNLLPRENDDDVVADAEDQAEKFRDENGTIPWTKIILSCSAGPGKNRIDDAGPFGPKQMSLENCELIADWRALNGIKHVHIRRVGMTEGGEEERVINQQMIAYLPNLGGIEVPEDALSQVSAWESEVIEAGGTVSGERFGLLVNSVQALMDAGVWAKLDGLMLLVAESEVQASIDLKRRITATQHGAPVAIFAEDGGIQFDGTQNYMLPAFTPSTDAVAMTGSSMMLGIWELSNVSSTSSYAVGTFSGTNQALRLNPRSTAGGGNNFQGQANCANTTAGGSAIADSSGLTCVQRTAAPVFSFWKNGVETVFVPATSATVLPTKELVIGALNNNGTINGWRATKPAVVLWGGSLTTAEHVAMHSILGNLLTEIGAI